MASWSELTVAAPRITEIFTRRHRATGALCMLATLRPDGIPRISPVEPQLFEGELWIMGMPGTAKFADLARDPRFSLHTATVDSRVSDGDAKVWGTVQDVADRGVHQRFAEDLFSRTGFDLRGETFDHFFRTELSGASSVEAGGGHLDVTVWREGGTERVIRKH